MTDLALHLLGPPRIEVDGQSVEIDTRKALAMLAYLGVSGTTQRRDTLAALLWPDYNQSRAMAALRRTLSSLKKALQAECLEITREAISLAPGGCLWVDIHEFRRLLAEVQSHAHQGDTTCSTCAPILRAAVDLYQDDFMAGFTLRDSTTFDDWQFFQAETLKEELAGALQKLALAYCASGDYDQAIAHARRWLSIDQLREDGHQLLMKIYSWSGQRNAALRQYRECVRILEQELGVSPLEETTELYQDILENRLPPPIFQEYQAIMEIPRRSPSPHEPTEQVKSAPGGLRIPFVGRTWDLDRLLNAYYGISDTGYLFVIEGELGIGKTRLANEFLDFVQGNGANVLAAQCYEGESDLAYAPFIGSLRACVNDPERLSAFQDLAEQWLIEARRLIPEFNRLPVAASAYPAYEISGPGAQTRFLEGLRQVILAACVGSRTGVLFIDDVHWADEASLDLLTYLVRRSRNAPLFTLVTWRLPDVTTSHRLRSLVLEAQRAEIGDCLSLHRLTQADVATMLKSYIKDSKDLSSDLESRFYQESEGLPFFAVEYLINLEGQISEIEGQDWSIPDKVRNLLYTHITALDEAGQQLLATAAVIGRSFDFPTLRAASGRSELETITGLEKLLQRGLISEREQATLAGEPIYDFIHEKLRDVLYQDISLGRRRLLHRRIGEALLKQARGYANLGNTAGQIARHFQLAGIEDKSAEYYKIAGDHERALYANKQALAHYQNALALNHPNPSLLHEAIGDLLTLKANYAAALASYETAAALTGEPGNAQLEHKIGGVYHHLGEWELAIAHFQTSFENLKESETPEMRARVLADWSRTAHRQGDTSAAEHLADMAAKHADQAKDPLAMAQVQNILGILAHSHGKLKEARQHLEASCQLAQDANDLGVQVAALNNLALVLNGSGELEQAVQTTQRALDLCRQQGDRHHEAALLNNLADLLHEAGDTEKSLEYLKEAVVIFSEIGVERTTQQPEIWKLTAW